MWVWAGVTLESAPLGVSGQLTAPLGLPPLALSFALSAVLLLAGWRASMRRVAARLWGTSALVTWSTMTLLEHPNKPGRGFLLLLGLVAAIAALWPSRRLRQLKAGQPPLTPHADLLVASVIALLFGFDQWATLSSGGAMSAWALAVIYAAPVAAAAWRSITPRPLLAVLGVIALAPLGRCLQTTAPGWAGLGLLTPFVMSLLLGYDALKRWVHARSDARDRDEMVRFVLTHQARGLVLTFLALCAVGAVALSAPFATRDGQGLSWLDATFTAVSAACVTGLGVVDTVGAFGGGGQLILLALIQIGGLGIMGFSSMAIVLMGERPSLAHERAAMNLLGAEQGVNLKGALKVVFGVTFITEGIAAALLFIGHLARGASAPEAAWEGIFTAVSAFCNAGFALHGDSLTSYAHSPYLLSVVSATIVAGGLGPAVIISALAWRRRRLPLHARLVLITTLALILLPALQIASVEWRGALSHLSTLDKLSNAAFQSITLRTAGFNTIDLTRIHPATWSVMIWVMFIGGSPGSTAGGAKTTTFAVLLLSIIAVVRGQERVEAFKWTLPTSTVLRAAAITSLGLLSAFAALLALLLTQGLPLDRALFEVVSALATVGLSMDTTGQLDEVGKIIIIGCMFAGRVGPLTLFVFLTSRAQGGPPRRYPEGSIPIG